jgi:hypothetical protein
MILGRAIMLKAIKKTYSMRFGRRVFVCLHNDNLPPALRKRVRPLVFGFVACWIDRLQARQGPA